MTGLQNSSYRYQKMPIITHTEFSCAFQQRMKLNWQVDMYTAQSKTWFWMSFFQLSHSMLWFSSVPMVTLSLVKRQGRVPTSFSTANITISDSFNNSLFSTTKINVTKYGLSISKQKLQMKKIQQMFLLF